MKTDDKYSLINYEVFRYKQKGVFNTVIGITTVVAYFLVAPYIGKTYFGSLIEEYLGGQQKLNFLILMASIHLLFTLGNFAYYLPLYLQKIPYLEKFRINRIEDWEWNKPEWPQLKKRFIQTYLLNHFVLLPGYMALDLFVRGNNISFRTSLESFPSLFEFFSQITFCVFVDDTVFYFVHWAAHLPIFYKLIHKKHHEYKNPFSLAGEFDSIYEYFLAGTLPPLMAFSMLGSRTHMWTYICYVFLKIGKQADQHCGYELPYSAFHALPFTGSGLSHTFHHTHNEGAIGSFFSFWDHIMKTDKEFIKYFYAYYEKKNSQQNKEQISNNNQQKVKQQ